MCMCPQKDLGRRRRRKEQDYLPEILLLLNKSLIYSFLYRGKKKSYDETQELAHWKKNCGSEKPDKQLFRRLNWLSTCFVIFFPSENMRKIVALKICELSIFV